MWLILSGLASGGGSGNSIFTGQIGIGLIVITKLPQKQGDGTEESYG